MECIGKQPTQETFMLKLGLPDREFFVAILEQLRAQSFDTLDLAEKLPVKTFDRFDELLPVEVLNEMNSRDRLDIAGAREAIDKALGHTSVNHEG